MPMYTLMYTHEQVPMTSHESLGTLVSHLALKAALFSQEGNDVKWMELCRGQSTDAGRQ